jgi:anti-sigma regulatory factor (Ser/Thr protein kinase)
VAGLSQGYSPAADEPPAAGCASLAAGYNWSDTDFGPQDQWDPAVEAVVRTLIEAMAPMAYLHGADYAMVYNDRFADLLGARHPRSWGQRAALVMPEMWSRPGYAKEVDDVFSGGPSFHDDGELFNLHGLDQLHPDWAYLARSYSAVRDSQGSVLGVLVVVVEIAPVLVLVGGSEQADQGEARWRGIELWDETVARQPLVWSGFRAGARPAAAGVSKPDQRFVADGSGQLILPLNGPDIDGSIAYRGVRRHLPDVQMVTLTGRDPHDAKATAGGEFYDIFAMPDGKLAITIGDVKGAGVAAAAVMAQVKVSIRGAALTSSEPSVIFTALDEIVRHLNRTWPAVPDRAPNSPEADAGGLGGELFVTALLGVFTPAAGDLLLASAGHSAPAILRRGTGMGEQADPGPCADYVDLQPGPPLGITGTRTVKRIILHEGDTLVAFTDGLLRGHDRSLAQGQSRLLQSLKTMTATAARSISQHVVDTLIGDKALEHDCALLVVVHDSRAHQMASVLVPPHTIAVRGARRWAAAQLESWDVNEQSVSAAVMCISELVTNVVQHAGTSARVSMELADRLLVTVEDTGSWSTPRAKGEDLRASQGRGLALVAAVSDSMGHARGLEGSTVWFEIALNR